MQITQVSTVFRESTGYIRVVTHSFLNGIEMWEDEHFEGEEIIYVDI